MLRTSLFAPHCPYACKISTVSARIPTALFARNVNRKNGKSIDLLIIDQLEVRVLYFPRSQTGYNKREIPPTLAISPPLQRIRSIFLSNVVDRIPRWFLPCDPSLLKI